MFRCRSHEEEQGRSHHCWPVIGIVFMMNEIGRREYQRTKPGRELHRNSASSVCMYVEIYVYCTVTFRDKGRKLLRENVISHDVNAEMQHPRRNTSWRVTTNDIAH